MSVLAIDAGNSRIKWALHDGDRWAERGTVPTAQADELRAAFSTLAPPARIVISNVAGEESAQHIAAAVAPFGGKPLWVVSSADECGVRSSYAEPARLGPDRWAALIAARNLGDGPCVVVNAGTTMTVDALSADGIFLGGFIVAGYGLMRDALARNTAHLKLQDGAFSFFPDDTGDAIASGALNALAGAIERMTDYLTETAGTEPMIVLSGGDAEQIEPLVSGRARVVDNLVLEGLLRIGANDV
ncbi:MAG TPA: type III pantothenate kinase [Burkholderiales bacterium]|nr:type III pantothenate kinase [Burkholderiales bacterium]